MRRAQTLSLFALASAALAGCGGGASEADEGATPNLYGPAHLATSGGEAQDEAGAEPAPEEREPVVLRPTAPVPVPRPAVPREELQAVWTRPRRTP